MTDQTHPSDPPAQDRSGSSVLSATALAVGRAELPTRSGWQAAAQRFENAGGTWQRLIALGVTLALGVLLLGLRALEVGPELLGPLGATVVMAGYAWALGARVDGRPFIAVLVALAIGGATTISGNDVLRGGSAVAATVVSAVLAVLVTVPAASYLRAVGEALFAIAVAALGAVAVVGFDPAMDRTRYTYLSLALSLAAILAIVYRLGAGLSGLGRRGLVAIFVGCVLMLLTAGYVDLIKSYGVGGLTDLMEHVVGWSRDHLGAFPRLIIGLVGVPALVWGTHMRARRRQGWWVCAFGVAGAVAVAQMFTNPIKSFEESLLSTGYGVLLGLLIGYALVRADLALTGTRGSRSRRAEEAAAVRPEPSRIEAL